MGLAAPTAVVVVGFSPMWLTLRTGEFGPRQLQLHPEPYRGAHKGGAHKGGAHKGGARVFSLT